MIIQFPPISVYDPSCTSIAFPVEIDGARARCLVTEEALMDHFGAPTIRPDDLKGAFEANRDAIQGVAIDHIRAGARQEIILRSSHF